MDKLTKPDSLPDHLGGIWDEMEAQVTPQIGAAGMEALCTQVYRMRDAQKRITEEGIVVADTKGNPTPHPALDIEKRAQNEVRQWLKAYRRRGF
jgi:hypothetical protein